MYEKRDLGGNVTLPVMVSDLQKQRKKVTSFQVFHLIIYTISSPQNRLLFIKKQLSSFWQATQQKCQLVQRELVKVKYCSCLLCNKLANLNEEDEKSSPKTYLSNCLSAGSILITSSSPASSPSAASAASLMTLFQMASAPGKALILKVNMATSPGPALNSSAPEISGGNWISNEA